MFCGRSTTIAHGIRDAADSELDDRYMPSVRPVLLAVRTPKEEQMLIERFGQQYREDMARTGRFFPHFPK